MIPASATFSQLSRTEQNKFLEQAEFLLTRHYIYEQIDLLDLAEKLYEFSLTQEADGV